MDDILLTVNPKWRGAFKLVKYKNFWHNAVNVISVGKYYDYY